MFRKARIAASVRINAFEVIDRAVEEGLQEGYRRAHKYTDTPGEDAILTELQTAVMSSLSEVLQYDEIQD